MLKKLASFAAGAGLLLTTAVPAFATYNSCINETTGPLSYNKCKIYLKKKATVNVTNNALITQNVSAGTNTGNNQSNNNSVGGNITTGWADSHVGLKVKTNRTEIDVTQTGWVGLYSGLNSLTGPDSDNIVIIKNKREVEVDVNNNATVIQNVNATANTGWNENNGNTLGGDTQTGNASVDVHTSVRANTTEISVSQ